ncbi:MAG: T9SS type A sorting domain-containing protein [Bacteroidales bacterium]|nr:T9SS type A sorting domain-containing protein [Bacteroidales bacterium]
MNFVKVILAFIPFVIIPISAFIGFQVCGQNTFEITFAREEDQKIHQVVEDEEGNFVLVGIIRNLETGFPEGYILKIDESGNLLNEEIFHINDTISNYFFDIHFFNDQYYIIGTHFTNLWYLVLNKDLEIQNQTVHGIPPDSWFSYMNSILDSDSNFVITGYTTRWDTYPNGDTIPNSDVFFYKLSTEGDSITSKFYPTDDVLTMSFDIIEKPDSSGYFAYGFKYSADLPYAGQRFELSKDMDSIFVDTIPYGLYSYCSLEILNDSSILICGGGGDHEVFGQYSLNALSTTIDNHAINYGAFKKEENMREFSSYFQGVSRFEDNIYIGGNSNFNYANPFFSESDSWFHLVKINPDITPRWEYWYGGDAYYHMYSMIATSDGGCLMVGNRYDSEIQYLERDIYVVKVNSDGLIVWTEEIPLINRTASVYPNPGTNQLNIRVPQKESDFELINQKGQVVIRQSIKNSPSTINTERLESGIYFYRVLNKKTSIIESGKWVKF